MVWRVHAWRVVFASVFLSSVASAVRSEPALGLQVDSVLALPSPRFVQPVAVAVGALGRLFVADAGQGSVVRLDASGTTRYEFEPPPGQTRLQPLDLEVTGFQVYVLDALARALLRYSDQGAFLDVLQSFGTAEMPRALAVDAAGRVVLAVTARHQVRVLDESQRDETTIGGFGSRPGEFVRPGGVACTARGAIWVADTGNARVQRFAGVGNFEFASRDSLRAPRGIAVGSADEVFVADPERHAVHLFGPSGAHRFLLSLEPATPLDVAAHGDTLWVLCAEPNTLVRVRVERGD